MRTWRLGFRQSWLLVACLAVAFDARAQVADVAGSNGEAQTAMFRGSVELVALNVVVTDRAERFVTGLGRTDFAVFEDGVKQDVSFFGMADVSLDLAILLDTSASMTETLETAQQAAIGLVSTLRPGDRVSVIDIKDQTRVLFPMGDDMAGARNAIVATAAGGGTALYDGTYAALLEMTRLQRENGEVRRQMIVVLSDGTDTASPFRYKDVLALAKESGIGIYTVSLRSQTDAARASREGRRYFLESDLSMQALARETGARAYFPADVSELAGIYASIGQELANQYALGYTSSNVRKDGAFRRVKVRVVAAPGSRTRTRSGYLSSSE